MGSFTSAGFGGGGFGFGGFGGDGVYSPLQALPRQYYLGLITSQYQGSPNAMAWMDALISPLYDLIKLLTSIDDAFDLDQAVGAQLDAAGTIVGVSRTVPFTPSGGVSPELDDNSFRILIKARIAWNTWDGQMQSLQGIWANLFPGGTIVVDDAQNMTATVILTGSFTSIIIDLINQGFIVPRPQGVLYSFSLPVLPIFGCDLNNSFIAGVDLGHIS